MAITQRAAERIANTLAARAVQIAIRDEWAFHQLKFQSGTFTERDVAAVNKYMEGIAAASVARAAELEPQGDEGQAP